MIPNSATTSLHILLVEDDEHDYVAFRRAFKKSQVPCAITRCVHAEEVLERLSATTESFDLVVTDYKLPGMSGLELHQELLAHGVPLPLVILTGAGSEHLAVEALKAGVNDYIIKDSGQGYLDLLPVVLPEVVRRHDDRLARRRAEQALRRHNRELALLNQVSQELTATLDRQQVAERLLQAVTETIDAEGALLWLRDEEQEEVANEDTPQVGLICWAFFLRAQKYLTSIDLRLRPGQGIAGWAAAHGESVVVADAQEDPRFFPGIDQQTGFHTTSLLAVPLYAREDIVGVLEVVNKHDGDFADDLALVETLAASAAIALDNAELVESQRQRTVELQARNEDLDAFAHTAAHDLKGPLGYMVGFAQVLEEDYAALSNKELQDYLHTIVQSGHKMGNIIDELLLLAGVRKLEEVEMRPLDMASIVAESQERLANLIEEHKAEITLPKSYPAALGHGPWVEEVWVNYLSNALKYGGWPDKGQVPRIELGFDERAGQRVSELANQQPGADAQMRTFAHSHIRFWVRDNGPGLTPEEQARLFTPFTRFDQVRTKGHGLGLSIVRRIVEKLGGEVGVESEVGKGSTFYFTLPSAVECTV